MIDVFRHQFRDFKPHFLSPPVVGIPNFQYPPARELPEVFKTHLNFIPRAIFEEAIAISKIEVFFSGSEKRTFLISTFYL